MAARTAVFRSRTVVKVVQPAARTTSSVSGPTSTWTTTPKSADTLVLDHSQDQLDHLPQPGPEMGPISDRTIRKADPQ